MRSSRVPQLIVTMRRYLTPIGCVLRPCSVQNVGQVPRCFAAFLARAAQEVTSTAAAGLPHIHPASSGTR